RVYRRRTRLSHAGENARKGLVHRAELPVEVEPRHVVAIEIQTLDVGPSQHDLGRAPEVAGADVLEQRLRRFGRGTDDGPTPGKSLEDSGPIARDDLPPQRL